MSATLKVYACVQWDASTETCQAHAYIDPPTVIPTLTAAEGAQIGWAMVYGYVSVKCVSMLRDIISSRIGY